MEKNLRGKAGYASLVDEKMEKQLRVVLEGVEEAHKPEKPRCTKVILDNLKKGVGAMVAVVLLGVTLSYITLAVPTECTLANMEESITSPRFSLCSSFESEVVEMISSCSSPNVVLNSSLPLIQCEGAAAGGIFGQGNDNVEYGLQIGVIFATLALFILLAARDAKISEYDSDVFLIFEPVLASAEALQALQIRSEDSCVVVSRIEGVVEHAAGDDGLLHCAKDYFESQIKTLDDLLCQQERDYNTSRTKCEERLSPSAWIWILAVWAALVAGFLCFCFGYLVECQRAVPDETTIFFNRCTFKCSLEESWVRFGFPLAGFVLSFILAVFVLIDTGLFWKATKMSVLDQIEKRGFKDWKPCSKMHETVSKIYASRFSTTPSSSISAAGRDPVTHTSPGQDFGEQALQQKAESGSSSTPSGTISGSGSSSTPSGTISESGSSSVSSSSSISESGSSSTRDSCGDCECRIAAAQ